jgi:zinc D-Ala-D-Ala carboxypeptidase
MARVVCRRRGIRYHAAVSSPLPRLIALLLLVALALACPSGAGASGRRVSRDFTLDLEELKAMTTGLPREMRDRIASQPEEFLHLLAAVLDQDPRYLLLVDKKHPLDPDAAPAALARLGRDYGLPVNGGDVQLAADIMPAVLAMDRAAREAGVTLVYSSGYRSYAYQRTVYAREVKQYGQEMADRESARPGMSQHQLGTAIDFGSITDEFAETRAGRWLAAHAGEFGFSLSYPQGFEGLTGYRWESWHYRYITMPATALQGKFFGGVQQYLLQFLHDNRAALESRRAR